MMTLDQWILLVLALIGLGASWLERAQEHDRRRFNRERGKYGQII